MSLILDIDRQRSDVNTYTSFRSSLRFFFFFFFRQWRGAREYIENNAQRVNRRANSSVGSFVSLFLTFIVVYCRQKFIVLCLIFVDHILIYIKKTNKKINLVNFTNIYTYSKKKIQIKYWIIAWWAALSLSFSRCSCCVLLCLLLLLLLLIKEKRRALRFTWLCYLVYVDFASSWLDLTLILIESTFTWY
jgi:hypothetical protein